MRLQALGTPEKMNIEPETKKNPSIETVLELEKKLFAKTNF